MVMDKLGSHKTTVSTNKKGTMRVTYHNTDVVKVTPKTITLDTGGYFTSTTKRRMNQASRQYNLGFHVFQKDYDWYVTYNGKTRKFRGNRMTLKRTRGSYHNFGRRMF